jgi:hypothetical protein
MAMIFTPSFSRMSRRARYSGAMLSMPATSILLMAMMSGFHMSECEGPNLRREEGADAVEEAQLEGKRVATLLAEE